MERETQKPEGLRIEKAITEEVSRQQIPNRELRPQLEKILFPDASEVKKTRVINKYDRER